MPTVSTLIRTEHRADVGAVSTPVLSDSCLYWAAVQLSRNQLLSKFLITSMKWKYSNPVMASYLKRKRTFRESKALQEKSEFSELKVEAGTGATGVHNRDQIAL